MDNQIIVTSPKTICYNCIAWALSDDKKWWWPDAMGQYYWPPSTTRQETIASFSEVFALLGYMPCNSPDLDPDYEKIALFADMNGKPTHAARQLRNGKWTSKLGPSEDVQHDHLLLPIHFRYGIPVMLYQRSVIKGK